MEWRKQLLAFQAKRGDAQRSRYPAELKREVTAFVVDQVRSGRLHSDISRELGIDGSTLRLWAQSKPNDRVAANSNARLLPAVVTRSPSTASAVATVLPSNGNKIRAVIVDGLSIAQLKELLGGC